MRRRIAKPDDKAVEKAGDQVQPAQDEREARRLVKTREVCKLIGWSPSWLRAKIRAGKFPPPDVPGEKLGAPDKWFISTVHAQQDELQRLGQEAAEKRGKFRRIAPPPAA